MAPREPRAPLDRRQRAIVRAEVARLLDSAPAYRSLPPARRKAVAAKLEEAADALVVGELADSRVADTVDFPGFVSDLIGGVFQAVVDASVQQMREYAELLEGASKSVDDFADDNSDEGQVRAHLSEHFRGGARTAKLRPGLRARPSLKPVRDDDDDDDDKG
jgi:hypothetical protein